MAKENAKITNINELQNVLGVKMEKVRTTTGTLREKAQGMSQVNSAMHNLLCKEFPQYYKEVETDVIVTNKEGKCTLKRVSGYHLLFPKLVDVGNEKQQGYAISKPTIYVQGGNSYSCLYYKEIGRTNTNK